MGVDLKILLRGGDSNLYFQRQEKSGEERRGGKPRRREGKMLTCTQIQKQACAEAGSV